MLWSCLRVKTQHFGFPVLDFAAGALHVRGTWSFSTQNSQTETDISANQTWHSISKPLIPAEVTE